MANENGIRPVLIQFSVSFVNQLEFIKRAVFHFECPVMLIGLGAHDANLPFLGIRVLKFV